jgi:glycine/D-amino acid oxidase-like deaminating enzyme
MKVSRLETTDVGVNGEVSFWHADMGGLPAYRSALAGDAAADVCIVGGGYSGLWTAYYLLKADPRLRVVVLEQAFAGFGASGRNGGWLSGEFAGPRERYLATGTRAGVIEMQRAMIGAVEEVIAIAAAQGIDADIRRADILTVARTGAQMARLAERHRQDLAWEIPSGRQSLIDAEALRERIAIPGGLGALVTHGAARVQPAKLARGLAAAVERLGGVIHERTAVREIRQGHAITNAGVVRAPVIVRATEGFTAALPGLRRLWLPLNSAMIVTEPISEALWAKIGWSGRELLGDASHLYSYAQRTREGRIAIGGRGVPYRFGSRTDRFGETRPETIARLRAMLGALLPQTPGLRIDHAWCGVLAVPRDWCASVGLDRASGLAWAGGYVGDGVSTANLAGRTLADLILGRDTALTRLPWVGRTAPAWEPEPLRWLAVHGMYGLYQWADRREAALGERTSALARLADRLTGR